MKLIVGLGNPGKEYEKTRHNLGFRVVELLAKRLNQGDFKFDKKSKSLLLEGKSSEEKILIMKPQTFMNLSGTAVAEVANFFKIDPEDIWVIADELDLPLGVIRIRSDDQTTTHKGIQNIIDNLKSTSFCRFRLGIKVGSSLPADEFVLTRFASREENIVVQMIEKASEIIREDLRLKFVKAETIDLSE